MRAPDLFSLNGGITGVPIVSSINSGNEAGFRLYVVQL